MNKKILACVSGLFCAVVATPLYAVDLMQVYRQALLSDPTFKKAQANWLSAKENLPISMSGNGSPGSGLFPYLDLSGGINRTYQKQVVSGIPNSRGYFNGNAYQITLTQPIFNFATWKSISSARYGVKAATATYLAAAQSLMSRVATAYFNVLRANDELRYTLASKKSFLHQLITAEQKFKVGLIAITGVYDAQASYDRAVANEIKDRNNLANQLENLRAITGIQYKSLKGLRKKIPLVIPKPSDINQWVKIADQQNYAIKSDLYTMLADHETMRAVAAGRYPTLTGVASYGTTTTGVISGLGTADPGAGGQVSNVVTTNGVLALNLNFPVFQGGFVTEKTKQAEYNYLAASDQLELQHRNVMNETRQAYLGVQSGISQIQADEQAIKSSRNKLEATQAGYVVGTRTMVDVLDAVAALYQSQETWANDRYNYVLSIIKLEEQAGTLSPKDLLQINRWLHKTEVFHPQKKVKVSRYASVPLPNPTQFAAPPAGGQPTRIFHQPLTPGGSTEPAPPKPPATPQALQAIEQHYFSIQLHAGESLEEANQFLAIQPLKQKMQIIYVPGQTDSYQVVYGNYKTKADADNALKQLPLDLERYSPKVIKVPAGAKNLMQPPESSSRLPQPTTVQRLEAPRAIHVTSFKKKSELLPPSNQSSH